MFNLLVFITWLRGESLIGWCHQTDIGFPPRGKIRFTIITIYLSRVPWLWKILARKRDEIKWNQFVLWHNQMFSFSFVRKHHCSRFVAQFVIRHEVHWYVNIRAYRQHINKGAHKMLLKNVKLILYFRLLQLAISMNTELIIAQTADLPIFNRLANI